MPPPERLSLPQARRIALAAQGFTDRRTGAEGGRVGLAHARRVFGRVDLIQIDSINVVVRTQEMPLFSRLGPHPRDLLPRMLAGKELFEYWCHEASLLTIDHWPLMRWMMSHDTAKMWRTTASIAERDGFLAAVEAELRERGPLTAGELSDPGTKERHMWARSPGKRALEYLFATGRVTAWRRPRDFARVYDLVERHVPAEVLARPALSEADAKRALLDRAGRSLGIATERCLTDYHRLNGPAARPYIRDLVEAGRLIPVQVAGWERPTYLHAEARLPRWVRARALLSPFDSLVWERRRVEELFAFRYRIEIYVPPAKRVHGYYVLPFLLGDQLVARVDLKALRADGALLVQGAWAEPAERTGRPSGEVAEALAEELALLAGWLDLDHVRVNGRGDLAGPLARAVATR